MMSLLLFILFGFVVGLIARAILPGRQNMSLVWTTLLGIAGSLIGGAVASALSGGSILNPQGGAGWIGSIVGALILLAIFSGVQRRRGLTV